MESLLCCSPIDPYRFSADFEALQVGGLTISKFRLSALSIERVRVPDERFLHFLFPVKGTAQIQEVSGDSLRIGQQSGYLLLGGTQYHYHSLTPFSSYVVSLRAAEFRELLPDTVKQLTQFTSESTLLEPVRAFLVELHHQSTPPIGIARYATERIIHELLSALILDTLGFSGPINGANDYLRERASAYIADWKNNPSLQISDIASELNVSVRHLQRVFQESGTTVSREIRRQRANSAQSILAQSKYDVLSVEQIAKLTGFSDSKDLRRALARFHGTTPREIRQLRRNDTPVPLPESLPTEPLQIP